MCERRVIEGVKRRMLSIGAAGGGIASAVPSGSARPPAVPFGAGVVVDLTHTFDADFPTWDGPPGVSRERLLTVERDGCNVDILTINEHTGTHVDAPLHFAADGRSVDELPVEDLVVPLCVIDIRERAAEDPDTGVTPEDVRAWTRRHGEIPDGACVAMLSGWGEKVSGPSFKNADAEGVWHFPGFHAEAAAMLLETGAGSIGVDTLSLDRGADADLPVHHSWLPAGRYGIEALANLDLVPAAGAVLVVGAPKHRGGTGGPARVFALT